MFADISILCAYIYFCLLPQAYHTGPSSLHLLDWKLRLLAPCRCGVNLERCFHPGWGFHSAPLDMRVGANKVTWHWWSSKALPQSPPRDEGETTDCKWSDWGNSVLTWKALLWENPLLAKLCWQPWLYNVNISLDRKVGDLTQWDRENLQSSLYGGSTFSSRSV